MVTVEDYKKELKWLKDQDAQGTLTEYGIGRLSAFKQLEDLILSLKQN